MYRHAFDAVSIVLFFLTFHLHRGSYLSAHVLFNLLNELRKSNKMRGLPSHLSPFHRKFNKFNNAGAGILDSVYHMTLKSLKNHILNILVYWIHTLIYNHKIHV